MREAGPFRVPGKVRLPNEDPGVPPMRFADSAFSFAHGVCSVVGAGSALKPEEYCRRADCPDYARDDFPQDRPHFHLGQRVAAPIEATWSEAKSSR